MFGFGNKNKKTAILIIPSRQYDESEVHTLNKIFKHHQIKCIHAAAFTVGSITGMNQGTLKAEIKISDIYLDECDALVLVGGIGAREHYNDMALHRILKKADQIGKIIGAIDYAPMILAHTEILHQRKATVIEIEEQKLQAAGAKYTNNLVEIDKNIVTCKGSVYAEEFAEAIARLVNGEPSIPRETEV